MVGVYVLFTIGLTTVFIIMLPSSAILETDELVNVQYEIDISKKPLILDDDDVILSSKYGQLYRCSYSTALQAEKNRRQQENENLGEEANIIDLMKPLETSPCLFYNAHWWTYELCYKKVLKQYHVEDGIITGDVVILGHFLSEFNWSAGNVNSSLEARQRYHSQRYTNGSVCDLTGSQREANVHVVCDKKAIVDEIVRVEEPVTCGYNVTVRTPRVCQHKMLSQQKEKNVVPISCHPALVQADLDRYSAVRSAAVNTDVDVPNANDAQLRQRNILFPSESSSDDGQISTENSPVVEIPVQLNDAEDAVNNEAHELTFGGVTVRVKVNRFQSNNAETSQQDAESSQLEDEGRGNTEEVEKQTVPMLDGKTDNTKSEQEELESPPPERVEIKILNAAYYDEDGRPVGKYPQNSQTTLGQMVMAVMATNADELAEYENHKRLRDNYSFAWPSTEEQSPEEQKELRDDPAQ